MQSNFQVLKYSILLFLGWRIILFFIAFLGLSSLPNIHFHEKELFFPSESLDYFSRWANWDGQAYQQIANLGYQPVLTVFFPLFSILIKFLTIFGIPSFWAGLMISQISTIAAIFYLLKLALLDYDLKISKRIVFSLILFPTSFYFVTLYSESLFLALTLGAFYFARIKNWKVAALFTSLVLITRLIGIAVLIGIIAEYLLNSKVKISLSIFWKSLTGRIFSYLLATTIALNILKNILPLNSVLPGIFQTLLDILNPILILLLTILLIRIFLPSLKFNFTKLRSKNLLFLISSLLPFLLYLIYLKISFGSFLVFLKNESIWGKFFTLPWNAPIQNFQFLAFNLFRISEYSSRVHLRFLIFIIILISLIYVIKKLRISYVLYFLTAFIIILSSGSLIDFPRYTLVIFPIYLIFGTIENEYLQKSGAFLFIALQTLLLILFFNSYFFM